MARAIAYIRVSKERDDMTSPEIQRASIDAYCKHVGHTVVEYIEDIDRTGRLWKRRQIEHAVQRIEKREVDVIVVWRISRVSRNMTDWVLAVDRVEGVGGHIESATEHFDNTATGGFARGQMALIADYESKRIGETWKETHARRITHGLTPTGAAQFGYAKSKGGYTPDPETGPVLRQLYLGFLSGKGMVALSHLSAAHGGPSTSAGVRYLLDRGFGAGYLMSHGELVKGSQEPVISEQEWKRYQAQRRQRSKRPRAESSRYPFSGLVYCECGARMSGNRSPDRRTGEKRPRYVCTAGNSAGGHVNTVSEALVEEAVLGRLREVAEGFDARSREVLAKPRLSADARPQIRRDLSKALARIDTLTERYLDGEVEKETHDRLMAKYRTERSELQERLDALDEQAQARTGAPVVPDLLAHWPQMPPEVKRALLRPLVTRIEVERGRSRWNPKPPVVRTVWDDVG